MLLDRIGTAHGKDTIGKAIRLLDTPDAPVTATTTHKVAALCQELAELTSNGEIEGWFRKNISRPCSTSRISKRANCGSLQTTTPGANFSASAGARARRGSWRTNRCRSSFRWPPAIRPRQASTPDGITVTAADTKGVIVWYQPATKRLYVIGRVMVEPTGQTVQDDAIDAKGESLHLNAPPAK